MLLVYAKHDCEIDDAGHKFRINAPEEPGKLRNKEIFVTTHTFAIHHAEVVQPVGMSKEIPLPPLLTREYIENPPMKPKIRMIAHNGIGGGIGDCIGSMDAFKRLHEEFWKRGRQLEIDILTQDGKWMWSDHIFMFVPYIHNIIPGGMDLPHYCSYDVMLDTEGYTTGMDASGLTMSDYACSLAHVDTEGPHRANWLIAESAVEETKEFIKDIPGPRAIVNFFASSFRSIPKTHRRKLVEGYAKQGYQVLVVARDVDAEAARWAMKVKQKYRSQVHDCTELTSRSLHHLAALTGEVDFVSTPDTGLMHICGLVGVPTVAVFYSIEPALRIRDYPSIAPFCPEAFRQGPHWGLHKPDLPSGILASNDKEKIEPLMKLYSNPNCVPEYLDTWKKVDVEEILAVKPGPRVESVVGIAPMEKPDAE